MIPTLFSIGPFPVNSFGLMVACSLVVAIYVLTNSFKVYGLKPELAENFAMTGGIVGLISARIWYILENWSELKDNLPSAIFSSAGFTFYGGFAISVLTLYILCKKNNIPFKTFLNAVGPTMTLGYLVGRLGCQLSGDGDYGIITNTIFGMSYSTGVVPTLSGQLAFPTPLYESAWCAFVLPFLFKIEDKIKLNNSFWSVGLRPFGAYLVTVSLERFFVEFLRRNDRVPVVFLNLSEAQIIALCLTVLGVYFFAPQRTRSTQRN